jgi:hypothetical protein
MTKSVSKKEEKRNIFCIRNTGPVTGEAGRVCDYGGGTAGKSPVQ